MTPIGALDVEKIAEAVLLYVSTFYNSIASVRVCPVQIPSNSRRYCDLFGNMNRKGTP